MDYMKAFNLLGLAVAAAPSTWSGAYRLPQAAEPVAVSIDQARSLVVLGAGHAPETRVPVRLAGGHVRFSLPGRPAAVVFDGRIVGPRVTGTVRQGALRGTFTLARGAPRTDRALGAYRLANGSTLGVYGADGPRIAVDFT